jgi:hypothetical protein
MSSEIILGVEPLQEWDRTSGTEITLRRKNAIAEIGNAK